MKCNGRKFWNASVLIGDGDEAKLQRRADATRILTETFIDEGSQGSMRNKFDTFKRTLQGALNEL